MIMNDNVCLEDFIPLSCNKEFLAVKDPGGFINTGVWFIKNTDYTKKVLRQIYEQDESVIDTRYWEQGAFNYLYDNNWNDLQSHCTILPLTLQHLFNCTMYAYMRGDFLIHFLGIRVHSWLEQVMGDHYPYKKDGENDSDYNNRKIWYMNRYKDERKIT